MSDAIAVVLPNGEAMIELYLAATQAGWYLVPINHHLTASEIAYIVDDSGAKVLVADGRFAAASTAAADEIKFPAEGRFAVGSIPGFQPYAALTEGELRAIGDSGASISCTPETELQMGMGRPVHARAVREGAATSLGIDIVSNFSGDMFAQMRLLLQSERGFANERLDRPPRGLELRTRDVLDLATVGGAEAAGLSDVTGSITPGKQADLIVVRTESPHMAAVCWPSSRWPSRWTGTATRSRPRLA